MDLSLFPAYDVIPLPAPVGLLKLLHILLLALHLVSVQLLLGGLLMALLWVARGGRQPGSEMAEGAKQAVRTLPVVTTYVINLGVPPLLFVQAMFGHALYSASVIIGVWWIGLIFELILLYYLLYVATSRAHEARLYWPATLTSLAIGLVIAFTFSTVMTLMLRPEVWADMYRRSAAGIYLPSGDPTTLVRWGYMICGGLTFGGLGSIVLGSMRRQSVALRTFFYREGATFALLGIVLQAIMASLVLARQPARVAEELQASVYRLGEFAWIAMALAVLALVGWVLAQGPQLAAKVGQTPKLGWLAALLGTGLTLAMTSVRDGIRDKTMLVKGFDVWSTGVTVNWPVLLLFLVLTVAAVAVTLALIMLVVRSQPKETEVQ